MLTYTAPRQPNWDLSKGELNEYGHNGRVLAPIIGLHGGTSTDFSLILDLVARELAIKHTSYYNIDFSEAKAIFRRKLVARQWGRTIARAHATLLLDRLHDFVVSPSSNGSRSTGLATSDADEEAALDHFHHFHSRNGRRD